jgi:hypothetical protein
MYRTIYVIAYVVQPKGRNAGEAAQVGRAVVVLQLDLVTRVQMTAAMLNQARQQ